MAEATRSQSKMSYPTRKAFNERVKRQRAEYARMYDNDGRSIPGSGAQPAGNGALYAESQK